MQEFIKVPASKRSLYSRGLVYGVGINDSEYITNPKINGKTVTCPIYKRWVGMIERCYSKHYQKKYPTYKGCSVCDEWLHFSNFEKWAVENYIEDYHLDKDLKIKGNKTYSPDCCLFIHGSINLLITNRSKNKGHLPDGVAFHKPLSKFRSQISIDSKKIHIGYFDKAIEASDAYIKAKNTEILRKSEQYPELAEFLLSHMI